MLRWTKWAGPMAALVLMAGFSVVQTRAADSTATGKATVTVTVTDASGKPVQGATITIQVAPAKKGAAANPPAAGGKKGKGGPAPVATGTSGQDGTYAAPNIPDGTYVVMVKSPISGNGRGKLVVADGKDEPVAVTLKPKKGAATPPAAAAPAN